MCVWVPSMVNLGVDCYPYKHAWYIFCMSDTVENFEDYAVSEDLNTVTCKKCIKVNQELEAMLEGTQIENN